MARPVADPRKVTHADCVASCRHYLTVIGAHHWKVWGGPMQVPGLPDIVACYRGRYIGIECKVARDKLRPEQIKQRASIEAAGGIYICAREAAAADVHAALQAAGLPVPGLLL